MIQQYESIGDFTKFKISDIGKVFNTLTKNLYPNPLLTVLIETVSNAHDSMVMCQKGLEPIFIKYNRQTSELAIQDTGEGMSPEFMEDGYTDVGRSGKENVVEAIGRYGLGRLSILAYAPQYFVDTIWDKVKYTYLVSENPLSTPDIELVNSQPVTDCNGVTVRLTLKTTDISKVEQYISQYLRYFPTLIVEGLNFNSNFKVYEGKTFKTISNDGARLKILNGCTLFPVDFGLIERPTTGSGQVLKFDLKEGLVATPNRADLIWTPETIKKVQEKYDLYVQEQKELFNEQVQFFDSTFEYKSFPAQLKIGEQRYPIHVKTEDYYTGNLKFSQFHTFSYYDGSKLFSYVGQHAKRNPYVSWNTDLAKVILLTEPIKPALLAKYKKHFYNNTFVKLQSYDVLKEKATNDKDVLDKDLLDFFLHEQEYLKKTLKTLKDLTLPATVAAVRSTAAKRNTRIQGQLYDAYSWPTQSFDSHLISNVNKPNVVYYTTEEDQDFKLDFFYRYKVKTIKFLRLSKSQIPKIKFLDKAVSMKDFLSSSQFTRIYNKAMLDSELSNLPKTYFTHNKRQVGIDYKVSVKHCYDIIRTFEKHQPFLYQSVVDRVRAKAKADSKFYDEGLYKYLYYKQKQLKNAKVQTIK